MTETSPRRRTGILSEREARKTTNQFALYLYLCYRGRVSLNTLYRIYCEIAGRRVRLATVRKQLKILEERYRAVRRDGNYYVALLPPEELLQAINPKSAKAGRKGALKRVLNLYRKPEQLQIPQNLAHYVSRIYEEIEKFLKRGDRTAALDLIVHTYLPLRENEVLWLWKGSEFIYYDNKNKVFRCLRSEELAKLLRKLRYTEGIMSWHILEHERATKAIRKLFGKGHLDWPWSRSIAYGLMQLGLIKEGSYYRVEALYRGNNLYFILKEYYTGYPIQEYLIKWNYEQLPLPLTKEKPHYKGLALGVPHTSPKNDESYFSRW